jgi:Protein of unknown function (DUF3307)
LQPLPDTHLEARPMPPLVPVDILLLALVYLAGKHALADFFLQTKYQWANKGRYGHPGGILHALIHAALSAPILLMLPPPSSSYGIAVLGAEFVAHYHCDWLKEKFVKAWGLGFQNDGFWRAMGIDQLVHGITYIAMVRALV